MSMHAFTPKAVRPVARAPSLHVSVQESIKDYIRDNKLKPGDALPPEGALVRQLGVGRNSVREALRALESIGILETRRGVGLFVKQFSLVPLLAHLPYAQNGSVRELYELCEIRSILECALVGKTVDLITEQDLAELRVVVARMKQRGERGEPFMEEDRAFHQRLFQCCGNVMLLQLMDVFWTAFTRAAELIDVRNPGPLSTWRDHVEIIEAIAARDAETARERIERHFHDVLRLIAHAS